MARPLRIEFSGAWYHVMNRGAGFRDVFHNDKHRGLFLDVLGELDRMFRTQTHAYCLMDSHYHLLVHTPDGNLQRGMRHLNGVYTQRYNRMEETDGPLFRGRYKAILIEPDSYLLNVSRYIHLNPVAAGLVERASDCPWSSYGGYIGSTSAQEWLHTQFILSMIGQRHRRERYRSFVETGIDHETAAYYNKRKSSSILGSDTFRKDMLSKLKATAEIPETRRVVSASSLSLIINIVAEIFSVPSKSLMQVSRGRGSNNPGRRAAIYVARRIAGIPLNEIALYFDIGHYASVSGIVTRFQKAIEADPQLGNTMDEIAKKIKAKI